MSTIHDTTDETWRDHPADLLVPAGAEPDQWIAGQRDLYALVGHVSTSPDLLRCPAVTVVAEQHADGRIGCIDVILDIEMGGSHSGLSSHQARELAGLLTAGADLADTWSGTTPTTDTRLTTAKTALLKAYTALQTAPGNVGDAIEVAR